MFKYPAKNVLCAVEPTELWMSHNDTRHLTDSTQGLFDSQVNWDWGQAMWQDRVTRKTN